MREGKLARYLLKPPFPYLHSQIGASLLRVLFFLHPGTPAARHLGSLSVLQPPIPPPRVWALLPRLVLRAE